MNEVVLGIDASLTGTGLVAVPLGWDLEWRRIQHITLGVSLTKLATERERLERMQMLALDVRTWAIRVGATHAWIEDLPTQAAFNIPQLAELRGFIRSELMRECGLFVERAPQSSIRKLFLGRLPPRERKQAVIAALDCMTDVFQTADEKDAFVVANWGLSELGAPCVALPPPPAVPRAKRTKAAA